MQTTLIPDKDTATGYYRYKSKSDPTAPRIQQGSVGRSAPGCQTRLHLQDPADGVGEVATTGRWSPVTPSFAKSL